MKIYFYSCAFIFALVSVSHAKPGKNVVLMISDNQTWFDCGCYGNDIVQTPHIDKLAGEGVRFREAFATTASCGPSRAVIYSGLLTHSNGQYAHPHREHNQEIRPDVTTVFEMVKSNGYRTGLIGKDHIRPLEKYPIDYKPRGNSRDAIKMTAMAEGFLNDSDEKPFLLVISFHDPHPTSIDGDGWGIKKKNKDYKAVTYDPDTIKVPGYLPDNDGVKKGMAGYYQQVTRMDFGVGGILSAIEKSGHTDDTLVIFTSDHGTSEPGAMGSHYEPGVRVPFIVRNPEMKKAGIVNKALVAFTDITPTILDWTGTAFSDYPLHGRSILPILSKPEGENWDSTLLSHIGHDVFAHYPMRTLRGRRYKLIWNITYGAEYPLPIDTVQRRTWVENRESGSKMFGPRTIEQFLHRDQLELYDLKGDPWEVKNLASDPAMKEIKDQMVAELVSRLEEQKDPWLRKYSPTRKGQ